MPERLNRTGCITGDQGVWILDDGSLAAIEDWPIQNQVHVDQSKSWSAAFRFVHDDEATAAFEVPLASGQFDISGTNTRFFGTISLMTLDMVTLRCTCEGVGDLGLG